jgi:hypothetical protein
MGNETRECAIVVGKGSARALAGWRQVHPFAASGHEKAGACERLRLDISSDGIALNCYLAESVFSPAFFQPAMPPEKCFTLV